MADRLTRAANAFQQIAHPIRKAALKHIADAAPRLRPIAQSKGRMTRHNGASARLYIQSLDRNLTMATLRHPFM